ncbi:CCR4-NOT transcription complex subunit 2 [Petromyzon marinus]|uniref:CCR4-NOT transcription complex subunit 2 n=1 Tax=Petromyzon marinus TaxID=7757 RepID=UPI003F6F6E19
MFGAPKKRFGEEGEAEFDGNMYFNQSSVFSHRPDKDMLGSPSPSGQLSQFGASLYGPQNPLGLQMRGMGGTAPQLNRSLSQGAPLPGHVTPTSVGPPMPPPHAPSSPSRGILALNPRMNHVQPIGLSNRANAVGSSGMGSPNRSSPNLLSMQKQQQQQQPPPPPPPQQQQQPPRSTYGLGGMSGFGLGRSQGYSLSNAITNNSYNSTGGSDTVAGLDLSDFPALAERNRRESNGNPAPLPNPMAGRTPYVGMVTKPASEQPQDFSIHNEDFPALPGVNLNKEPTAAPDDNKTLTNQSGQTTGSVTEGPKFPGDKGSNTNANQQKKGIQILQDGRVTNIPSGMVTDQFGMIGLLTFIRAAETEPSLVHLALGSDLTTLGLNLNSPENLYPKFASPWAEAPCRPQDIDFHVPSEYLTNIHIRDKLAPIKLSRYGEDLLFYMYYTNGGDILQLAAAVELYNRDWRYHKDERVWITRAPGMEPQMKTNTYERGTYLFFDCHNWRKVAKEFHLEYDKLEERPHLPTSLNYNPAQQAF